MDRTRSRRLTAVYAAFAAAMAAFVLADGLTATLQDALGLVLVAAGLAMAALYWYRPELLSLESRLEN